MVIQYVMFQVTSSWKSSFCSWSAQCEWQC